MNESSDVGKEITRWGIKYLLSHGYTLKNILPDMVQHTPWSYVVRFSTDKGYIYLKHTPPLLGLEANIIQVLRDQFHAHVPTVIAHNTELYCFLMKDAGKSLRILLKEKFDIALVFKAIDQFTSLQSAVADRVDALLDIGVPDWRLDKLPDLYKELISQKDILRTDGLSEIELDELEMLLPEVVDLCNNLSRYAIKQTLVQPDFNDNNSLIDDQLKDITIIDLGEIVISHPFFSHINFMQQMKKHHAITEKDPIYLNIKERCLKNYKNTESEKHLLDALAIANRLFFIYGALGSYRLKIACDEAGFTPSFQRHARPAVSLKEFLSYKNI